ncbi:DUF732 domain-containing protein [Mycobacterium sp.]|uniref:DUF732 domain-containing protein n=1 Tax=Mycobacterium sp. TaxID=1785 RepID=UPI002DA59652|nr:DUF732 domain-containing protein [Mycobacterium sp.]
MFVRRAATFLGTAAAVAGLGLAALGSAATAGASSADDTFMEVIGDHGIEPPSAEEAIGLAHDVCSVLDDGGDLVDAVTAVSNYTDLDDRDSAYIVGASIGTYCPEHEAVIG